MAAIIARHSEMSGILAPIRRRAATLVVGQTSTAEGRSAPRRAAVASSSRSNTFSKRSRRRRAPHSSSSASSSACTAAAPRGRHPPSTSTSSTTPRRPRSSPSATRSSAASLRNRSRAPLSSAAERGSDVLGSPRRWWRTSAARNSISSGSKPRSCAVLHEVRRVPVVALPGDVLADVVQQRARTRASRGRRSPSPCSAGVWSNRRSARRATCCGVRRRRSCSGARGPRPRRGAAHAGRPTSRRGRGCGPRRARCLRAAPSRWRSARRRSNSVEHRSTSSVDAGREQLGARSPRAPGSRRRSATVFVAMMRSCSASSRSARDARRPLVLAGIVAARSERDRHAHEVVDACRSCRPPCAARGGARRRRAVRARRGCASSSALAVGLRRRIVVHALARSGGRRRAARSSPSASPAASPIMNSTLPPPMSMHSAGAGSSTTLARTAAKIEAGLFDAADHLDLDAGLGLDAVDELAAVRRGADRARRLGDDLAARPSASASWRSRRTARDRPVRGRRAEMRPWRATSSPRRSISFSRATA